MPVTIGVQRDGARISFPGLKVRKCNHVPRVLKLFGQRLVARTDSGVLEFHYLRISAVKQCKPLRSSQSKN